MYCRVRTNVLRMLMRWRLGMASSYGRGFCGMWKRAVCNRAMSRLMKTTTATILRPGDRFFRAHSFLTTTSLIATRGCHNRCGFCYLATDGLRMPYRMRHPQQVAAEFADDKQPYAVFIDNNLGSRPGLFASACARFASAQQNLERGCHH